MSEEHDPQRPLRLAVMLETIRQTKPEAFARLERLIDKMLDPNTTEAEIAEEVSRVMGIPPGRGN